MSGIQSGGMYERYSNREVWRAAKLAGRDAGLARGNGPDDASGNSLAMHWRTTGNETAPVDGALQAGRQGWPSKGQDLVHVEKVHVEKAGGCSNGGKEEYGGKMERR